jgi:hypothetical protein
MSFDVKTRLSKLRSSAKHRNIRVDLDVNKYQMLVNMGCHYCGISLENENGYCLDRVDSSRGYIFSNVVGCCKTCNIAKSSMGVWEFVAWLKRAYKHTTEAISMVEQQEKRYCSGDDVTAFNEAVKDQPKLRILVKRASEEYG